MFILNEDFVNIALTKDDSRELVSIIINHKIIPNANSFKGASFVSTNSLCHSVDILFSEFIQSNINVFKNFIHQQGLLEAPCSIKIHSI
jgi:hypothetical protein